MPLTYSAYLKVDELLKLQSPLSEGPEHDETLFIVIHQVYELWFKQVLHEMKKVQTNIESYDRISAIASLNRVLTIFKTLVAQVDVLETMTPLSFASFRSRLDTASGFQSMQFRELEFLLGHRSQERVERLPGFMKEHLSSYMKSNSLYDSFLKYIDREGFEIPISVLSRNRAEPNPTSEEVQQKLIEIYRTRPDLQDLCERLVDLDEGIQEWRYRHIKMVERTIGVKMGTGGSPGAAYLKTTLFQPLFPDLWAIRSQF